MLYPAELRGLTSDVWYLSFRMGSRESQSASLSLKVKAFAFPPPP